MADSCRRRQLPGRDDDMRWLIGHLANNARPGTGVPPRLADLVEQCRRECDPSRFTLKYPQETPREP